MYSAVYNDFWKTIIVPWKYGLALSSVWFPGNSENVGAVQRQTSPAQFQPKVTESLFTRLPGMLAAAVRQYLKFVGAIRRDNTGRSI
jgi:hypothetical protein